jgi:AcrR family transcriptional regulator
MNTIPSSPSTPSSPLSTSTPSTRARIIAEASRLFAAYGIKATTLAQIEIAVGLKQGSGGVHRYFATKDDLVTAVLDAQLVGGQGTLNAAQELHPLPEPESVGIHLRMLGRLVLSEAEKNREVALIMLRDAAVLGDRLGEHRDRNDALAYGAMATAVRDIQELVGDNFGIDADAFGYLFTAPLVYFKLIEWASGRPPLDIDHEALVDTWAATMEPMFRTLVAARQEAGKPQSRKPRTLAKRSGRNTRS